MEQDEHELQKGEIFDPHSFAPPKETPKFHKITSFPIPSNFENFQEYRESVIKWYTENSENYKNTILPQPVSFTIKRLPISHECIPLKGYKNAPQFIGSENRLWYQELLLSKNNFNLPENFILMKKQKKYEVSTDNVIHKEKNWSGTFINPPPRPQVFSDFKSYEEKAVEWAKNVNSEQNLFHPVKLVEKANLRKFEGRDKIFNEQENAEKYRKEVPRVIDERFSLKYFSEIKESKDIKNYLRTLRAGYDEIRFIKFQSKYSDASCKKFVKEMKSPDVILPSEAIKALTDIKKFNNNFLDVSHEPQLYTVLGKTCLAMQYFYPEFDLCNSNDPQKAVMKLFYYVKNVDIEKSTIAQFYVNRAVQNILEQKNSFFFTFLFQHPHIAITIGKIMAQLSITPLIFYGETAANAVDHPHKEMIMNYFIINVLLQYHVTHIFTLRFPRSKNISHIHNQGVLTQLDTFFRGYCQFIVDQIDADISEQTLPTIVAIMNLILDCPFELKNKFFRSFPNFFNTLNKISMIDNYSFRCIILPLIKVKENKDLLFNNFPNYISFIKFEETISYTPAFLSMIRMAFIYQNVNIKKKEPSVNLEYAVTLISHLIQFQDSFYHCYAIDAICAYVNMQYTTRNEDPCYMFEILSLLFACMNENVSHFIVRSIGRFFLLPESHDFIISNTDWFISFSHALCSKDVDVQTAAWRTFYSLADKHLTQLLPILRLPEAKEVISAAINKASVIAIAEILKMLASIFERNVKADGGNMSQKTGMLFALGVIPSEIVELTLFFVNEGFKTDEMIKKMNDMKAKDEHFIVKFAIAKFRRVANERQAMVQLLSGKNI